MRRKEYIAIDVARTLSGTIEKVIEVAISKERAYVVSGNAAFFLSTPSTFGAFGAGSAIGFVETLIGLLVGGNVVFEALDLDFNVDKSCFGLFYLLLEHNFRELFCLVNF